MAAGLLGGLNSAHAVLTVLGDSGYTTTGTLLATATAPATLNGMDHHSMYVWQVTGLPQTPSTSIPDATWATLTLTGIYNWDNNPNRLYLWMFNGARYSGTTTTSPAPGVTSYGNGVTSYVDDPSQSVPDTLIKDDFAITTATGYGKLADSTHGIDLTPNGNTANDGYGADGLTFGGPGQAVTYTYVFTPSQVATLNSYLADGKLAFGFDSDCHYYDTSIVFRMGTGSLNSNLSPVPEGISLFPLLGIISVAGGTRYWRARRAKRTEASVAAPLPA